MNLKKALSRAVVTSLLVAVPFTAVVPAQAEAGIGGFVGALIGAGVQLSQTQKMLKQVNNTEEGRQALFQQMKEKQGVNNDYVLNARVDRIMSNLTSAIAKVDPSINEKPYNYFINPSTSFNAACSLGHNMTINTGIFDMLKTDDEIAVVLGHEMGHGQKDHVIKGFEKGAPMKAIGAAVASSGGWAADLGASVIVNYIDKVHLTKPMEWEADNLSFEYIANSNYNLGACAAVWEKVIETSKSNGEKLSGDIFSVSDHPSHEERRDSYAKKLSEYSGGKVTVAEGIVKVNGKEFISPSASSTMSSGERAFFVAGNLARAYHDGNGSLAEVLSDNGTVFAGQQAIITPLGDDPSVEEIVAKLKEIK